MAAAFKTSKSELVAIYRLEFYKKQKNWKFCSTERKKEEERRKAAKKTKAKLNQTYSIEPDPENDINTAETETEVVALEKETEQVQVEIEQQKEEAEPAATERTDNLNEAFVDTETDENVTTPLENPPTGPYNPKWSIQQWAARCRPWNCDPTPPQAQNDPSQQPYHVLTDPSQPFHVPSDPIQPYCVENSMIHEQVFTDYGADLIYERKEMPHSGTNLPHGANMLEADGLRDRQQVGGGWPRRAQAWTGRQEGWFEEICDIPEEAIEALELGDGAAGAGDGGQGRGGCSLDEIAMARSDSLPSVSSGSFTRGAALAPHSTELDLTAGALSGDAPRAGALSAAALAAAVAGHAAALAALLAEARRRDVQVSPPPADQLCSFKDYPTRDTGYSPHTHNETPRPPYAHTPTPSSVYTHNPTVVNDVFVAGSFNNRPDLCGQTEGRGRGRKVRVVGIEMGRPYRL